MRDDCRICMFSIAFVHLYVGRNNIIDFSAYLPCPEVVSNVQHEPSWHECDQMIKSHLFKLYHQCSSLPFFAQGRGMRCGEWMEWLIHMCFPFFFSIKGKDI